MSTTTQTTARHLLDWTARRSSAFLTIDGRDFATGEPAKVTCVEKITVDGGEIHALDREGRLLARLAPSN